MTKLVKNSRVDEGGGGRAPKALPLEEMLSGQLVVTGARSGVEDDCSLGIWTQGGC